MVNRRPRVNDATIQWELPRAVKEAAQAAARREGISLSEWLLRLVWTKLEQGEP